MLEVIKFIFSSFWVWLGSFMMLTVLAAGIAGMVDVFRK